MKNTSLEKVLVIGIVFLFAGASVLLQVQPTAKADITDGLVAYWSFNEGSGTTLTDNSGNAHDGTIYGATWTSGIAGNGLEFDGVDDYVTIPHSDVWNFGDGKTSSIRNPTHNYSNAGNYTVKLIVTDNEGTTDTYTTIIRIPESKTPGFEILLVISAIALIFFWKRSK